MITLYKVRKINLKDIIKYDYDMTPSEEEDNEYWITQQQSNMFRQLKVIIKNEPYENINSLRLSQKSLMKKKNKKQEHYDELKRIELELLKLQRIEEIIFVEAKDKSKKDELTKIIVEGFKLNGVLYKRYGKSNSQAKDGVTVFVAENVFDKMYEASQLGLKIDKCVISKYESYRNLTLSACEFVEGKLPYIVIIGDYEKSILNQKIRHIVTRDKEVVDKDGNVKVYKNQKIVEDIVADIPISPFDGMGIHSKKIGAYWAEQIGAKYIPVAYQIRLPFLKGVSTEVPFEEILLNEYGITTITDIEGVVHNVSDIDCIWTISMWKGYKDFVNAYSKETCWTEYKNKLEEYNFCLSFSKHSHDAEHTSKFTRLNFQYLQSLNLWNEHYVEWFKTKNKVTHEDGSIPKNDFFDFTDESKNGDIVKLAKISTNMVESIVYNDSIIDAMLFLGMFENSFSTIDSMTNAKIKSIMLNPEMYNNVEVKRSLYVLLKSSIEQMKYGKIFVDGNYNILLGDVKAFLEYAIGLDVIGCLNAHEFYCPHKGYGDALSLRSPLVDSSEVNKVYLANNDFCEKYLQRFKDSNVVMINCHDISMPQQGGADLDGDIVLITQNPILINAKVNKPIIVDMDDKVVALQVEYNLENIVNYELNTRDSRIGEITNLQTSIANRLPRSEEEKNEFEDFNSYLRVLQG